MATAYITEFSKVGTTSGRIDMTIALMPPIAEQTVAIGVVASSAAFNDATKFIRVHVDAICSIKIGASPQTAAVTTLRMAANQTEYFGVTPGHIISVITNT